MNANITDNSAAVETIAEGALAARADDLNDTIDFAEYAAQLDGTSTQDGGDVFVASPYTVINKDKDMLLSKPFILRNVSLSKDDDTEQEYIVGHLVTKDNELYVMTDGSTGIKDQLVKLINKRKSDGHPTPNQGIVIPNGLRKSEYFHVGEDGKKQPATTYYLA